MIRRILVVIALIVLVGWLGWRFRPTTQGALAGAGRVGPRTELAAEGFTITTETVKETVPTLGTLLANEQVNIVAESARRVVQVHVEEGALVGKGALLFKLDDATLRADLMRLEGRHALAAANEARLRSLVAQKLVADQEYDRAQSELKAIVGEMEVLRVAIGQTEIRAPFAGRVGLRRVSPGAYVNTNTVLTTLTDVSQLKLDFTLPERYSSEVMKGQTFNFKVEGRGDAYVGRVAAVEPGIDTNTRSVVVRGVVPNPGGRLTPGASASVEFEVRSAEGILIPSRALVPSIKGHSVFLLENGKAAEREVTIGLRTPESVQIVSGLKKGDVILTSNLLRLRPGIPVKLEARRGTEGTLP